MLAYFIIGSYNLELRQTPQNLLFLEPSCMDVDSEVDANSIRTTVSDVKCIIRLTRGF